MRAARLLLAALLPFEHTRSRRANAGFDATCATSLHEPLLQQLVQVIFNTGMLQNGSVVDCGAHKGGEACYFAELDPMRVVHAVEPIPDNLNDIKQRYGNRTNLQPLHGGLGSVERTVELGAMRRTKTMLVGVSEAPSAKNPSSSSSFQVHRLDGLFERVWHDERLAFGHFDVEGSELDLLQGATATIRRDRPVITVELNVLRTEPTSNIMAMLHSLDYHVLLVPEQCGLNCDCRNVICVPKERPATKALLNRTLPLNPSTKASMEDLQSDLQACVLLGRKDKNKARACALELVGESWLRRAKDRARESRSAG